MLIFSRDKNRPISTREDMTMRYSNYIFDLYATLIDIHTDQKPIEFWRRIAAIMDAYGAVYEPVELRTRYRQLIHEHSFMSMRFVLRRSWAPNSLKLSWEMCLLSCFCRRRSPETMESGAIPENGVMK